MRWKARHPDKVLDKRLKAYSLTLAEYESLRAAQGDCCALCGKPPCGRGHAIHRHQRISLGKLVEVGPHERSAPRLAVDHDHATSKIRALLCTKCNTGLGCFGDDESLLLKAIEYLRRHRLRSIG